MAIDLKTLQPSDKGRWVKYLETGEIGKIKSWNDKWVFVVYHSDNKWANYDNYTAAATNPSDLEFCKNDAAGL